MIKFNEASVSTEHYSKKKNYLNDNIYIYWILIINENTIE